MRELDERLAGLDDAPAAMASPRDLYRRLQFIARVLREAPVSEGSSWLLWFDDNGRITGRTLGGRLEIGRASTCEIMFASPRLSRRHCAVEETPGGHVLTDLESTGGTQVNGVGVKQRLLQDGDVIEAGGMAIAYSRGKTIR